MSDVSKNQEFFDTSRERVYGVLAKWRRRATFFMGERDRLTTEEVAIYWDCIADLKAALRGPCAKQTTRATIIAPDGRRFVGENDCANPQPTCPRAGMPTGVGYELCQSICQQTGHAEVNACRKAGHEARGGTLYLEGHYYACEPCKAAAEAVGVTIVIGSPP